MSMIAVDTSALVAVLFNESDAVVYADALLRHRGGCVVAAPTLLEATMVIEGRLGPAGGTLLHTLLQRVSAEVATFDADVAMSAIAAWQRFGKGRHVAGLNYGDCISYALASTRGIPLLFKGQDFAQTDIRSALSPQLR